MKNNNVGIVRELVGARVDVNQMEEVSDTCDISAIAVRVELAPVAGAAGQ